jgi:hypothetical protein
MVNSSIITFLFTSINFTDLDVPERPLQFGFVIDEWHEKLFVECILRVVAVLDVTNKIARMNEHGRACKALLPRNP